jgi:DNA-binding transcriptional ArsR family regulator
MQDYESQAKLFKALNHPTRLAILDLLRDGEQCVCHLEAHLGLRQAYISQQLMILREVGLVQDRRDGWNIFYHVVKTEIYEIIDLALRMNDGSKATVRYAIEAKISNPDCPCPKCQPALEHTPV